MVAINNLEKIIKDRSCKINDRILTVDLKIESSSSGRLVSRSNIKSKRMLFISMMLTIIFAILPSGVIAANLYVRDGGTNTTTCSDWTTANACDQVSAALGLASRGDVIYVADGTYTGFTFSEPTSGSNWVTIQKATVSTSGRGGTAHGTGTGWISTYGDGQATFTGTIDFDTGYLHFDGVVGGGPDSWKSGHGFVLSPSTGRILDLSATATDAYITIEHVEFTHGSGWNTGDSGDAIFSTSGTKNHIILSHLWVHQIGRVVLYHNDGSDVLVQYSYMETPCGQSEYDGTHCEHFVTRGLDDLIVRYNILKDGRSTGWIVVNSNRGEDWEIYGNVFGKSEDANSTTGLINAGGSSNDYACNVLWFNNSNLHHPMRFRQDCDIGETRDYNYNNIYYYAYWYNSSIPWAIGYVTSRFSSSDYNYFSWAHLRGVEVGDEGANDSPFTQRTFAGIDRYWSDDTSDPFTDWANDDYSLSAELTGYPGYDVDNLANVTTGGTRNIAGDTITDSYNIDMFGSIRGADGTWDRGAIEYGSTSIPLASPKNLRIVTQ